MAPVRRSIPDHLMRSKDAVQFDSQKKFGPELFTEYDESECLLDMPSMGRFFDIFPKEFDMNFYGVDIIVDVRTGTHYVVDCNYLSNYEKIPLADLIEKVDGVIEQKSKREGTPCAITGLSNPGLGLAVIGAAIIGIASFITFKKRIRGE
mmetsp:Transcript_18938/g.25661  ORF Transcript_18938/g.25661 Transcript_18938/m.25661 type:complete len:150 (+) Transcript_18938:551-1000(+)